MLAVGRIVADGRAAEAKMTFQLVQLPKRFAYVEDDLDFLDVLRMTRKRGLNTLLI